MGSIYQPCFNTHCCWCSPCGATRQPGCAKYISAGCESYKQGCHTSDGKQWFSWPPNKSLTLGLLVTRDTVNNSLTTWLRGTMSTLWKVKSRMFRSLVYCLWLTGARVMKGANNMPALCEIRVLPGREEIGWLVLHSGNCLCPRLPDTGGAPWTNLSHIRSWAGQE